MGVFVFVMDVRFFALLMLMLFVVRGCFDLCRTSAD